MSEITKQSGEVVASHGGKHEDWAGVDTACKDAAYLQLFDLWKTMPDTAFVGVNGRVEKVKEHGVSRVFQSFEKWTSVYEHGHHDKDKLGREKHWEGTRRYEYVALVETKTV